jgi:hypothetical protein
VLLCGSVFSVVDVSFESKAGNAHHRDAEGTEEDGENEFFKKA